MSFFEILERTSDVIDRIPLFKLKGVLSICLEEHTAKLVEIDLLGSKPCITNFAIVDIPEYEGEDGRSRGVAEALQGAYQKGGFRARQVFLTILTGSVFLRRISLPPMPKNELKEAIRWEADNQIPFSMDSAYLDWQFLTKEKNKEGLFNNHYLLAACSRGAIDFTRDIFKALDLEVVCVSIPAFAIANIFKRFTVVHPGEDSACIDIGSRKTNIIIFRGSVLHFAREIPIGYDTLDEILSAELPVLRMTGDSRYINVIKSSCDFGTLESRTDELIPGVSNHQIFAAFSLFFERIVSEISRSFDYFKGQVSDFGLCKVYLSGIGAQIKNIDRHLRNKLETPVEIIHPTTNLAVDKRINKQAFQENFSSLAIPIGAVLGGFDQINFHTVNFQDKRRSKIQILIFSTLLALGVLVGLTITAYFQIGISRVQREIALENSRIASSQPDVQVLKKMCDEAANDWEVLETVEGKRAMLAAAMKELANALPKPITLESIQYDDLRLTLQGYVFEEQQGQTKENVLVDYIVALNSSELIENAHLVSSEKGERMEANYNAFTIECEVLSRARYFGYGPGTGKKL